MGQAVFTPCCLTWGQIMVEVMKVMVTSFKRSHACMATLSGPNPAAGHQQPTPLLEMPGHSQTSLGQSLVGSLLLSPRSWCTRFCVCPPRVYFPDPCKFWQLYGGVNGDLQDVLCHTQVCCTQSPCPCGSPLLTRTSAGDAQTPFCFSLCGAPGSWCAQGFVCALQEYVSSVLCKFLQLCGGIDGDPSKRAYATPRSTAPRAPAPAAVHC